MAIENILTKIIVNTNKLPYEKQKQLLQITQDWLDQAAASNSVSEANVLSKPDQPQLITHQAANSGFMPTLQFEPLDSESQSETLQPEPQAIDSNIPVHEVSDKPIYTKDDVVVNIIEERAYERKDLSIPIDFVSAGQLYKEVTKDLSAGGLFIKTKKHTKFKKNQKVSMVFELSPNKKPFKLTGKIIRIESEGIAVQFHNISPFECVAIEEELYNNS
ncbi:MAG: PilZ domain-containing protein [Desulfamplus sp.]